jgi:hypothetical protein
MPRAGRYVDPPVVDINFRACCPHASKNATSSTGVRPARLMLKLIILPTQNHCRQTEVSYQGRATTYNPDDELPHD